jgi:hypothetical protein
MQKIEEVRKKHAKLKDYIEEAGPFFRQKAHYSSDEQIAFIVDFYANFMSLMRIFEENEPLPDEKPISVNIGKTVLTKKLAEQEFDAAVSVIYFNLSKEEILSLEDRAKINGNPKDALILRRLFEKFLNV